MDFFDRLLDRIISLTTVIGLLAVAVMMIHITIDVVGKFVFSLPVPATITLVSNYYMVVVAFLPLALAERRNAHISVEVLTERLPMRVQQHIAGWTFLLSAAVFGLLTYRGFLEAMKKQDFGSFIMEQGTKVLIWPPNYLLPIGTGLMTILLLAKFARYISGREQIVPPSPIPEAD